jgi:hydroxypyruvate reductase
METPKSNHPMFLSQKCNTILVGNNQAAVLASAARAELLGYSSVVLGTCIEGEAKEVANVYAAMATYPLSVRQQHLCPSTTTKTTTTNATSTSSEQPEISQYYFIRNQLPLALIAGGETTVTISHGTNVGRGGRNQELGLAVALILQQKKLRNIVFATVGTDGTDGPTDAAGVVVDGGTIARIEHQQQQHLPNTQVLLTGTQALQTHDSYTFFSYEQESHTTSSHHNCPAFIKTGPTGTNVADIAVILIN